MRLSIKSKNEEPNLNLDFKWKIHSLADKILIFQLYFEEPSAISSARTSNDIVQLFLFPEFLQIFRSKDGNQELDLPQFSFDIVCPPQIPLSLEQAAETTT
jgi:hypothetical protein